MTISSRFHNRNSSTCWNKFSCKTVPKVTITYSGFQNSDENSNKSSPVQDWEMWLYQMNPYFKDFWKLVTYHSCRFQRRRKIVSNVQSHYRKVTQGSARNSVIFCEFIPPSVFDPISADVLLLQMVVIVPVWAMIQLEAFLTPLLPTVFVIDRTI